jgi:hypothetical protein
LKRKAELPSGVSLSTKVLAGKALFAFPAGSISNDDYLEHSLIRYLFGEAAGFSAVIFNVVGARMNFIGLYSEFIRNIFC